MGFASDNQGVYRLSNPLNEEDLLAAAADVLMRRLIDGPKISDPQDAGKLFQMRLAGLDHERFEVAYLSSRHQVIAVDTHSIGSLDGAEIHPREIVRGAIKHNAAAVILAHNHPSHCTDPSSADRAVTARLKQALALIDCRVLDHFVVGATGFTSMAARGWV